MELFSREKSAESRTSVYSPQEPKRVFQFSWKLEVSFSFQANKNLLTHEENKWVLELENGGPSMDGLDRRSP